MTWGECRINAPVTKMNVKRRNPRLTSYDTGYKKRRITQKQKQAILDFYEKGLKRGRKSDELLFKLHKQYDRSPRQLQIYIAEERERKPHITTRAEIEHWRQLMTLAEALRVALSFPSLKYIALPALPIPYWDDGVYSLKEDGTYSINIDRGWYIESGTVKFTSEMNPLYNCLLDHLDAEFRSPSKFSDELTKLKEIAGELFGHDTPNSQSTIVNHQMTLSLREKLLTVVDRGTFRGSCRECKPWYK
jgi:hypothetical protein